MRTFLILSIAISVLIPFSNYEIQIEVPSKYMIQPETLNQNSIHQIKKSNENTSVAHIKEDPTTNEIQWEISQILSYVYFIGLFIFIIKLILHITLITRLIIISKKKYINNITVLKNKSIRSPFSFFKWIFIPEDLSESDGLIEIIEHERTHASQYHSFDIVLIELLSAAMWFNPLIWRMRKEIQQVHEYLADEGALSTGIDKLKYQALLINLVAEERLICLSSSFNHSLIKKRMIMMTKSKFYQHSKLRILILIPLATILFLGVACINGHNKPNQDVVTAVEPVKMNVFYAGIDNPIKIATSGYNTEDITVSIDNGTIAGKNGEYIVHPNKVGTPANITVSHKDDVIQKTTFRVKSLPNPDAMINGKKGGSFSKKEIADFNELKAYLEDFDFDAQFKITEFTVSCVVDGGFVCEVTSHSSQFTDKQKELLLSLSNGSKVFITGIKCTGPDGKIRKLSSLDFIIEE